MGLRVREDGESESCTVMAQIEGERNQVSRLQKTSRESGPTSIWSFITRELDKPTKETSR
jgi:hypothetical protein